MSLQARVELVNSIRNRYVLASKVNKSLILDEFTKATGYVRKHAIAVLNSPSEINLTTPKRRARKYDDDVKSALLKVWRIANEICYASLS